MILVLTDSSSVAIDRTKHCRKLELERHDAHGLCRLIVQPSAPMGQNAS